jgi:hypothetical protein
MFSKKTNKKKARTPTTYILQIIVRVFSRHPQVVLLPPHPTPSGSGKGY